MMWYWYDERLKGQFQGWGILVALGTGVSVALILRAIDSRLAKRFPQHKQVKEYDDASKVYEKIQEQIRKEKFE
jgi:hypothetical protein